MNRHGGIIHRTLLPALLLLAGLAHGQDDIDLEFASASLDQVVDQIAELSGQRFLLPSLVEERTPWSSATVTFSRTVAPQDLVETCRQILETRGFTLVAGGDELCLLWRVNPLADGVQGVALAAVPLAPVDAGSGEHVPMDFAGVELEVVLDAVADLTARTLSYSNQDTAAKRVWFRCPRPVATASVPQVFREILAQCGLVEIDVEARGYSLVKIVQKANLPREEELARRRAAMFGLKAPAGTQPRRSEPPEVALVAPGYPVTRPVATDEWELSAEDALVLAGNQFYEEVNLRSYYDPISRQMLGIQLRAKVPSPQFARLGLRNRDVLTAVGGVTITGVQQLVELLRGSLAGEVLEIAVLRNDRPTTLKFHLRPPGSPALPLAPSRRGADSRARNGAFPSPDSTIPMDFRGVELVVVVNAVADLTRVAFLPGGTLDEERFLSRKVYFRCPVPVPEDRLLLMFQVMLETEGFTLAPARTLGGEACVIENLAEDRPVPGVLLPRLERVRISQPTDPAPPAAAVPPAAGDPATITIGLPEAAAVGETFVAAVVIDCGSRNLAAYGLELKWDPTVLRIEEVKGTSGFDPPFVVNLESDKGVLRWNAICVEAKYSQKVHIADLSITVLSRPPTGKASVSPVSPQQTVAVYADDGISPMRVPVVLQTATVEIR